MPTLIGPSPPLWLKTFLLETTIEEFFIIWFPTPLMQELFPTLCVETEREEYISREFNVVGDGGT